MTLQNQTNRTENLVYQHLARRRGVNCVVGANILRQRDAGLRAAASSFGGATLANSQAICYPAPRVSQALRYYANRIMSANLGNFIADETAMPIRYSSARAVEYVFAQTVEGLKHYTTREGIKEAVKFVALGTIGTLAIW